jgi:uncharacterized protein
VTATIIDTGPLVAYVNRGDRWHRWAVEQMAALQLPLLTCEAVLTEACFLVHRVGANPADLVKRLVQGSLAIGLDLRNDASQVEALMRRYSDTPMSLADACLVRLTEIVPDCRLFTLDSDFMHYRRNGRQVIPLLHPR